MKADPEEQQQEGKPHCSGGWRSSLWKDTSAPMGLQVSSCQHYMGRDVGMDKHQVLSPMPGERSRKTPPPSSHKKVEDGLPRT